MLPLPSKSLTFAAFCIIIISIMIKGDDKDRRERKPFQERKIRRLKDLPCGVFRYSLSSLRFETKRE